MVRGDSHLATPRSWIKRLAKEAAYPVFLRQFDAALVVGEHNRAYWQHYGYPAERMFSSPHCVDTEWFSKRATLEAGSNLRAMAGIRPGTQLALFAGKLVDFKRPTDAVLGVAGARALGAKVELLVAGSGPLDAIIRATAAKHNVPLHMLGFCNQTQMPAVYAAADVLILPSTGRETWGLVANEAVACGLPVVLSDAVGCAPDLIALGRAGRTFPMADVVACGQALNDVLSCPPAKMDIAQVSDRHSIVAAAQGIIAALNAIQSKS